MTHRPFRSLPAGLAAGGLLAAAIGVASAPEAATAYMRVEDVKPGMKGYGMTVMSGTRPERFEVEVVSTLHGFRPGQDLILVKTRHPRLKVARTVAGMSGSPIYIGGKMIGAYAYGWYFNVEPIAGVTPIHNMLDDLKRPVPPALIPGRSRGPLAGGLKKAAANSARMKQQQRLGAMRHRFASDSALDYDLEKHAAQVAKRSAQALAPPHGFRLRPATTDLMVGGLSPSALAMTEKLVGPAGFTVVQAGGAGAAKKVDPKAPTTYIDGGVVTVPFVRGDISISGLGTVTHVVGDKLIAFGHPMMNGGIENMPTALGHVHWILATANRSFKIGEATTPLGALVNDRQASIVVHTKTLAPTFPVTVKVKGSLGSPKTDWSMKVAHDPFLAANFTAVAIGSAVETTASQRHDLTWRARSKLSVDGYPPIVLEDFGAGNRMSLGPSDFVRTRLVSSLGAILNNPWEEARINGIETEVSIVHKRETLTLKGTQLLQKEIDAGQPARIRLTLEPYLGKRQTKVIEVPIPANLAGKQVEIRLSAGFRTDRQLPAPNSLKEMLRILPRQQLTDQAVVASYKLPDQAGATFKGKVASSLPPGAADTLRSTTRSVTPEMFTPEAQHVFPLKGYMIGTDTVRVKVREVLR